MDPHLRGVERRNTTSVSPEARDSLAQRGDRNEDVSVCIVAPFGTANGGAESWLLHVLDHGLNRANGFRVTAVVMADGPLVGALEERGCPTRVVPTGTSPAAILRAAGPISAAVKAGAPDVVVANGVKAQLALAFGRPLFRRPLVWVKHDHSFDRALARPLGRAATTVVAASYELGLPTGRRDLVVVEPPRPQEPMERSSARDELTGLGLPDNRPLTLAMLTRLVPYKGVDVAVRALTNPAADAWQLAVIGGDDPSAIGETQRIAALAGELGLEGRVHLLGEVPGASRLLTAADALAVMTRPDGPRTPGKEGYGTTATEAMLAGIPVITAGPGSIASRLATAHGPAGLVIDRPEPDLLAEALGRLADPSLRGPMGKAGRVTALGLPDANQIAQAFAAAVRSTADRR